jgi:N-acetylglucosaminyldiphosphoundecaprenol N-acetyl-beta-D-mannosaminyltransferase
VNCQSDMEFRESLLISDLCPPDGASILWLGRLLGVPLKERVAGSDIFAALESLKGRDRPLRLFLFGGNEGVAEAVSHTINARRGGAECVGWLYPGFLPIEELSRDSIIDRINACAADFLVVSLGGQKGQLWLKRNVQKLQIPIRAHFGASLNFEAGTVRRAPRLVRKIGFEWLWRIKEEPYLWRRYWHDGWILLRLVYGQALPLLIYRLTTRVLAKGNLTIETTRQSDSVSLKFGGAAINRNVQQAISALANALPTTNRIVIDLSDTSVIDSRFLGLLLIARKWGKRNEAELILTGLSSKMERVFRLNGVDFLLSSTDDATPARPAQHPLGDRRP